MCSTTWLSRALTDDGQPEPSRRVTILAQDLIWSDRLDRAAVAAGASAVQVGTMARFEEELADSRLAIVDLTAQAYDPMAAIRSARAAGATVLAVGQHDDLEERRRALAAGADRVLAYRKLATDGPAVIRAWIERAGDPLDVPAGVDR